MGAKAADAVVEVAVEVAVADQRHLPQVRAAVTAEVTRLSRLPNGLRVVTRSLPGARAASLGCWVGTGSRDEAADEAGTSHFLEHLLFKGTSERGARDLAVAVDSVGGDLNAFTTKELTAFYARVPASWAAEGAELLFDVVTRPALRADDVASERAVIVDELRLALDDPTDRVQSLLYEQLFVDHPLGWDVSGSFATVEALDRDRIAAFHHRRYRAPNIVVAGAGAVDHDRLVEAADAAFGDRNGDVTQPRRAPSEPPGGDRHEARDLEEVQLSLGWRGVSLDDADRHAVAVLAQALGGGPASRLFHEIRETRGLAYSVHAASASLSDTGTFEIHSATAPERAATLIELIGAEVAELLAGRVTADEVAVAKGYLSGSVALGFEDSWSHLSHIANSVLVRDRVVDLDEYLDAIDAVTVDDVTRVAQRVLGPTPTVAAVGPLA